MFKDDRYFLILFLTLSLCVFSAGLLIGERIGLNSGNRFEFFNKE